MRSLSGIGSSSDVQIRDNVRHLAGIETRPRLDFFLCPPQHGGAVPPENGDHRDIGILAPTRSKVRRTARRIIVAAGACFGRKGGFSAPGVAAVFKHSSGPDI